MANDCWATPQYVFDWLNDIFKFQLDAACNSSNCKCGWGLMVDRGIDALKEEWNLCNRGTRVWLNPPYSDPLPWVKKAYEESLKGAKIVCLLPADISTKWFHDFVIGKAEVWLIKGRVHFDNPDGGKYTAPKFGSLIAIYGPEVIAQVKSVNRPEKPRISA